MYTYVNELVLILDMHPPTPARLSSTLFTFPPLSLHHHHPSGVGDGVDDDMKGAPIAALGLGSFHRLPYWRDGREKGKGNVRRENRKNKRGREGRASERRGRSGG